MSILVQVPFDSKNKEHVKAVCDMHTALLPDSVLPKMGRLFMEKFYYVNLPKDGLIDVFLYEYEGKFVGFFSGTADPFHFLQIARKKYFFLIACIILLSLFYVPGLLRILTRPSRITAGDQSKVARDLDALNKKYGNKIGEFLSFGVLPEYRKRIDDTSGHKISYAIMHDVYTYFKNSGKTCFIGVVIKKNLNALKFYSKFRIEYTIDPADPAESVVVVYFVT